MGLQHSLYGDFLLLTSAISLVVVILAWRSRKTEGGTYFLILAVSIFIWVLTGAIEAYETQLYTKAFWSQMSYFGLVNVGPSWFFFIMSFCGYGRFISRRLILGVWALPAVVLLIALTNNLHHLLWPTIHLVTNPLGDFVYYEHGFVIWTHIVYSYLLVVGGSALLLYHTGRLFLLTRRQAWALLACALFPLIGNILYVGRLTLPGLDPTPIAFTITSILLTQSIRGYGLLELIPMARESVFQTMSDAVIVLDREQRIVDLNPAARNLMHLKTVPMREAFSNVFASWPELVATVQQGDVREVEIARKEYTLAWWTVNATVILNSRLENVGMLIVARDTTARKRIELEREQMIKQLEDSLAQVKKLSGLLPICANCKKVRNDQGYWQQVEHYFAVQADVRFTHGLCPDCTTALFPSYAKARKEQ